MLRKGDMALSQSFKVDRDRADAEQRLAVWARPLPAARGGPKRPPSPLCPLQDLCAVAPPPTQPLGKLDSIGRSPLPGGGSGTGAPAGTRRSTAADLLQEKYQVKVRSGTANGENIHCRVPRHHVRAAAVHTLTLRTRPCQPCNNEHFCQRVHPNCCFDCNPNCLAGDPGERE